MLELRSLLLDRLNDYRKKNDTATGEDVIRHQGAIRELNGLLKILTPTTTRKNEWDGGFGE
jgi:hypothetical protein